MADWKGEADTVANSIPAIQHHYGTQYGEGEHSCLGCPQDNTGSSSGSILSQSLSRTEGEKSLQVGFGNHGDYQKSKDGLSVSSGVSKDLSKVSKENTEASQSRVRPEPDYPAGTGTGAGIPVPVNRNRI